MLVHCFPAKRLLISAFAGTGIVSSKVVAGSDITSQSGFPTTVAGLFNTTPPSQNANRPKAFINYIFFDEQFKLVTSGFSAVNNTAGLKNHFSELQNLAAAKNGYVYIYVSNESPVNVFFDNLQVIDTRGAMLEETHYYPFGLTMSGISSKALKGAPKNKRKWNKGSELESKEFSDGSGLELYSTFFRSLDPQLGRWWQIDPKPDYAQSLYSAMGNNAIRYNDPLGDTLKVTGNDASKKQFISINNDALGGFYKTKVGADGKVQFVATDKKGKMTKEQKAYYNEVSGVLNQKETISVGLVQNDKSAVGDNFHTSKIDVSDMAAIGNNNKAFTTASAMAHAIVEQNAKQKDGVTSYAAAHAIALKAEVRITGYHRDNPGQVNSGTVNSNRDFSGTVSLPYYRYVGPAPFGKAFIDKKVVTLYITDDNITKSEEQ